jgi:hypothetical protein
MYLAGITDLAIYYDGQAGRKLPEALVAYTDADYAGDVVDCKSRIGTILLLNNVPIL